MSVPAAERSERARDDWTIFLLHWLKSPLRIGSALPSGPRVARAMARQMQLDRPGPVVELGAGTGGITRGLVIGGAAPERLVLIESEPRLAAHLRRNYPKARVLRGDAREIGHLLDGLHIDTVASVISSLPIKWFPVEDQRHIVLGSLRRLGPGGAFIQITNAMASPVDYRALGIKAREVERVWFHFLPIQVWKYWLD